MKIKPIVAYAVMDTCKTKIFRGEMEHDKFNQMEIYPTYKQAKLAWSYGEGYKIIKVRISPLS